MVDHVFQKIGIRASRHLSKEIAAAGFAAVGKSEFPQRGAGPLDDFGTVQ